jgi:glycosyltransferase involved in cell wall biosynthesis
MADSRPRVSVVLATRNRSQQLARMLRSCLNAGYTNLEVVVSDGASSDDTGAVLQSFPREIVRWISEPDAGEYEALNRAIRLSTGRIIRLMTDDDVVCAGSIQDAVCRFEADARAEIVFGHYRVFDERRGGVCMFDSRELSFSHKSVSLRNWLVSLHPVPLSPTAFVRREVFDRIGLFSTDYVCGDTEFWARAASRNCVMTMSGQYYLDYHLTGGNGILRKKWCVLRDHARIAHKYGGLPMSSLFVAHRVCSYIAEATGIHPLRIWNRRAGAQA